VAPDSDSNTDSSKASEPRAHASLMRTPSGVRFCIKKIPHFWPVPEGEERVGLGSDDGYSVNLC